MSLSMPGFSFVCSKTLHCFHFSVNSYHQVSGEISEHLPVPKGPPRNLERDLGQGPGVTGQREWILSDGVDLDGILGRNDLIRAR